MKIHFLSLRMLLTLSLVTIAQATLFSQITDPKATEVWEPEPRKITPVVNNMPPSDAIVLFDGKNMDAWTDLKGNACPWQISESFLTVVPKRGDIKTKKQFGDCQIHIEWRAPLVVKGEGQGRGNSGIFLQEIYELQVLDSYDNRTYSNGQSASIYKQTMPLVNANKKPGEWQVYEIIYKAPRFNADGILTAPPTITVIHNGVLVQHNTEIKGATEYIGLPKFKAHEKGSLRLQDHGDLVSFRNIWIREL
jgi:hypothetical protein